jgi:bacterial/archaeal transporter family protein
MELWALYALCSAACAALVAIFAKKGFNDLHSLDSTLATTIRAIIMAVFLIGISLYLGKIKLVSTLSKRALYFIAFSGIAGALSWLFYFSALQQAPAGKVSAVAALDRLSVVFVLLFAILFLGEHFTLYKAIGAFLITAGAILMNT